METIRQSNYGSAAIGSRRSVDLDIAGEDFMLHGQFSDWESGLAYGPDLDRVNVRLAIDATSVRDSHASVRDADKENARLFAFQSREVVPDGRDAYRATGTFTGPRGTKSAQMTIEIPPGHSALIVLSFSGTKQDFGDGWHDLIANVVPFVAAEEGEPTRQAHAWLLPPALATA